MKYQHKNYKAIGVMTLLISLMYSGQSVADTTAEKAYGMVNFKIAGNMKSKPQMMQWTMKATKKGKPVVSGEQYQLVNLTINQGLGHQKRTLGANLGFLPKNSTDMNMRIQKKQGSGQVHYGDMVALNLTPYGWLKYKKQGWSGGINLGDDDNTPHYIWEIRGAKKGTKLVSGMPFALYNTSPVKKEVFYCGRTSGIDLGWFNDTKCGGFISDMSGIVFGPNGALAGESGKALQLAKDYICEAAVGAAATYAIAQTGAAATPIVTVAAAQALKECKKL